MKNTHTPTPWYQGDFELVDDTAYSEPHNGGKLIAMGMSYGDKAQERADIAFIIKAVNNHEALVSALEKFVHAAVEKHQDIHVADAVLKDPSYLRKYAADYDFAWPQYIYEGVAALAAAKGDA